MSIPSVHSKFSDKQAITASAASTNVLWLDSVATQNGKALGTPLFVKWSVDEEFNNLTSLRVDLQTSDNGTDWLSLCGTTAVKAHIDDLSNIRAIPFGAAAGYKKAVRLYYTVTGSEPTEGKVSAELVSTITGTNDFNVEAQLAGV